MHFLLLSKGNSERILKLSIIGKPSNELFSRVIIEFSRFLKINPTSTAPYNKANSSGDDA